MIRIGGLPPAYCWAHIRPLADVFVERPQSELAWRDDGRRQCLRRRLRLPRRIRAARPTGLHSLSLGSVDLRRHRPPYGDVFGAEAGIFGYELDGLEFWFYRANHRPAPWRQRRPQAASEGFDPRSELDQLPKCFDRLLDRGRGNFEQSTERLVQFEDEEYCARDREGSERQGGEGCRVEAGQNAKTAEQEDRP